MVTKDQICCKTHLSPICLNSSASTLIPRSHSVFILSLRGLVPAECINACDKPWLDNKHSLGCQSLSAKSSSHPKGLFGVNSTAAVPSSSCWRWHQWPRKIIITQVPQVLQLPQAGYWHWHQWPCQKTDTTVFAFTTSVTTVTSSRLLALASVATPKNRVLT